MKSCMPIKLFLGCELHLFFGATLLSNCQLPPLQPSFVCPCVVSLCSAVWFYVAKNDYMAAIYQPLCHCYATVISLCCLSTELTLTLIFPTKISLFRHWWDGVYFTTNSYFLDCLILYDKFHQIPTLLLHYRTKAWITLTMQETYQHYFVISVGLS